MNNKKNQIYKEVSSNPNFPSIEQNIIKYWQKNKLFEKSVEIRNEDEFVFYDGPPFANGLPHYGHLLTGFVKDAYGRYQTAKGKKVERRFGWDCHGLPAEMQSEKELNISGRIAIKAFGIDKFNSHCRDSVMKYANEWEKYVTRQARWVDFQNSYKTMDKNFMESVLWAFKELYKKGYIYEAMRVMPYSWACETPLSHFETRLDNSYRERADKAITVGFELQNKPAFINADCKHYKICAWTTTPWTLPSNLALAVHTDIVYVAVLKDDTCHIVSKSSLKKYEKELGTNVSQEFSGKNLVGLKYIPLFDYFAGHENAFQILSGDFITDEDGTGVVHMAPGFGEDDMNLCEQHKIKIVCPVDNAGKFTSEVYDFKGINVFDSIDDIIIKLKKEDKWLKTEQYLHNYPHCWRTDTPLIYKAVSSWYVKVTEFKDRMVELNQQINWIPGHIKDGLFGKWLQGARDWSISRNRFWGTPIPVWKSNDPKYPRIDVYGSIEELERDFNVKVTDLHRPFIDQLTRKNPDDPTGQSMMIRCEDIFDCWFESGSVPYAQVHYPFENKDWFENHFPADFIVEYVAQTRGWFYTLMVLSTAIFDRPPFLNCICHGVILDSTGQKLSKRLNNYPDPLMIFDQYGSDAMRFTMLSSSVVKGYEFLIDKEGQMIYDALRLHIKPIWNAYHFLSIYANADGIKPCLSFASDNVLDSYILSKLKIAVEGIDKSLSDFDSQNACEHIIKFFEVLNNWYIRRSRPRFWKKEHDIDKESAYNTLYTCLITIVKASASLIPLISEEIYLGLNGFDIEKHSENPQSVHLEEYPDVSHIKFDSKLVSTMDHVIESCSKALFIRNQKNIRIRQPLGCLTVVSEEDTGISVFSDLIKDEVNVKEVKFIFDIESYATKKLSLNFPVIGKRLPHNVKDIIAANKAKDWSINEEDGKLNIGGCVLNNDEYSVVLEPKDSSYMQALDDQKSLVMLDLEITESLMLEGIYRDIVRIVQQARKDADLYITDEILLSINSDSDIICNVISEFKASIEEQCLARLVEHLDSKDATLISVDVLDYKLNVSFAKVS